MEWEIVVKLVVALVLGGVIGLEREYRSKDAGFRTHFLVALGSALFTIVSGIGFLGAGTIIFQRNIIRGLTTAAGLWVTAAVGMACGTGLYILALATTILVLLGLEVVNRFVQPLRTRHMHIAFRANNESHAKEVVEQITLISEKIYLYSFQSVQSGDSASWDVSMDVKLKRKYDNKMLTGYVKSFDNIQINRIE